MKLVDRLAELRRITRNAETEAASIRQKLIAGEVALEGDAYTASIRRQVILKPVNEVHEGKSRVVIRPFTVAEDRPMNGEAAYD
jgi:hypothetical protein